MAPKPSGKKVVGTAVRSTRRVFKENVAAAVVQRDTQESTQEEENEEAEDIDVPAGKAVRTIPVEEKVLEEEEDNQTIGVSVEEPNKDVAINGSEEQEEPSAREEEKKDQDQTSEVSQEEPSKEEEDRREVKKSNVSQEDPSKEEDRREDQTSEISQEQPSKEGDRKQDQTSDEVSQEQLSKEKQHKHTSTASTGDQETEEETGRKEGTGKGKGNDRKRKRKRKWGTTEGTGHGYKRYVFRVLKQVHPELRISSMAMSVINRLMNNIFERIGDEAAKLSRYKNRRTLSSGEIQGAVKLVLPGELGKHAIAEGSKAITNYMSYQAKRFES